MDTNCPKDKTEGKSVSHSLFEEDGGGISLEVVDSDVMDTRCPVLPPSSCWSRCQTRAKSRVDSEGLHWKQAIGTPEVEF